MNYDFIEDDGKRHWKRFSPLVTRMPVLPTPPQVRFDEDGLVHIQGERGKFYVITNKEVWKNLQAMNATRTGILDLGSGRILWRQK